MSTEAQTPELTPDERVQAAAKLHAAVEAKIQAYEAKQQGYRVAGILPPPTPGMKGPYNRVPQGGGNILPQAPTYSVGAVSGIPAWAPLAVVGIFGYLMATGFGYAKSSRRAA